MLDQREISTFCPYCGESIDVLIDESAGPQSYYEDCPVCCAPILLVVTENEYGEPQVEAKRDDD